MSDDTSKIKLIRDDFGIWANDEDELSIIKEGFNSKQIADYILRNQEIVERLQKKIQYYENMHPRDRDSEQDSAFEDLKEVLG